MPVIIEGKHQFDFLDADNWYVFKYDESDAVQPGFYRERIEPMKWKGEDNKPGEGLKGVDIVAGILPPLDDLTLLEIKDF